MANKKLFEALGWSALVVLLATAVLKSGCQVESSNDDKSQDIKISGNPAEDIYMVRSGYVIDSAIAKVVDNPDVNLSQPYYILVRPLTSASESECYFLPRPDHTEVAMNECNSQSELGSLLKELGFCANPADPNIINELPCDKALEISTFLNNSINFVDGPHRPLPLTDDKAGACEVESCQANPLLASYCSYYQDKWQTLLSGGSVTLEFRVDTEEEEDAIAPCLNTYYGVGETSRK